MPKNYLGIGGNFMKKTLRRMVAFVVCLALCAVPMQFTPVSATTTTATPKRMTFTRPPSTVLKPSKYA